MYLKEIEIKNWQCIEKTSLNVQRLTLLIGAVNQGKSSVISAIMYFLNYRKIRFNDIKNIELPLEMTGIFENISVEEAEILKDYIMEGTLSIKVIKAPKLDEEYKIFSKYKKWEKIEKEIYIKITSLIKILFIPDVIEKNGSEYFFNNLIKILEEKKYDVTNMLDHLKKTYEYLDNQHASKGLYRKLIFETFKNIAYDPINNRKPILGSIMLFFEEPELYLHPQASKELYEIFQIIARIGVQLFISTHSSNFISLKYYKSICIVRNDGNGAEIFQYKGNLFSGDELKNFNMNYWINPDRGELFFADKVILVEGQTDKVVLSALSKKLKVFKYEYSIIECSSKGIIPQFIKLLNAFLIPYIAVYDRDNHFWRTEDEKKNSNIRNADIQRAIYNKIGKFIEFENDIEEEIYNENRDRKNYKNKPFFALKTVMEKSYIIPPRLKRKVLEIFE
ncbi:MAG: AAA family ATPase [Fusobacteriaceae bacterium]|jgi:putative ATP-dependent endonuclease of OLD family|nr:AAA family ATPase [Fusobacteriaceae bacterium]